MDLLPMSVKAGIIIFDDWNTVVKIDNNERKIRLWLKTKEILLQFFSSHFSYFLTIYMLPEIMIMDFFGDGRI